MKKVFYLFLSLMMCIFTSCQKDEDVVPEPEPEPKPGTVKEAMYETNDDYVDLGFDGIMFATKNLGAKKPAKGGLFLGYIQVDKGDQ